MKFLFTDSARHLKRLFVNRGVDMAAYESFEFSDGELGYRLEQDVKRQTCSIIASVGPDPRSLFDILAVHRLLRENGAHECLLVLTYLGYARQDRRTESGEAAIGIMVAEILRNMNTAKIFGFDLHSDPIRKSLGPNFIELSALDLLAKAINKEEIDMVVAPDEGARHRTARLAKLFDLPLEVGWIEKVRPRRNVAVAKSLHGNVSGKHVLILDDMIDTGGTIEEAVRLVSKSGAMTIRIAATHGIFSGKALDRLSRLPIREIFVTNTLPQKRLPKLQVIDVSTLILESLQQT